MQKLIYFGIEEEYKYVIENMNDSVPKLSSQDSSQDLIFCAKCDETLSLVPNENGDGGWVECVTTGWYCPSHSPTCPCNDENCPCCSPDSSNPVPELSLPSDMWREVFSYNKPKSNINEHEFKSEDEFIEWYGELGIDDDTNGLFEDFLYYSDDEKAVEYREIEEYLADDFSRLHDFYEGSKKVSDSKRAWDKEYYTEKRMEDVKEEAWVERRDNLLDALYAIYEKFHNPVANTIRFDKSDESEEILIALLRKITRI